MRADGRSTLVPLLGAAALLFGAGLPAREDAARRGEDASAKGG